MTWQNLVFTLPAQVDFAQNQQVIFLVHYDTISESAANDANNCRCRCGFRARRCSWRRSSW